MVNNKFAQKTEQEKKEVRRKIINYVKEELNKNRFPGKREIQRRFNIRFYDYFDSIANIYEFSEIGVLKNPYLRRNPKIKGMIKENMIRYIRDSLERGHRPTVEDIRKRFRSGIEAYFPKGIMQLYREAGIDLNNTFSFLYKEKEIRLTPIVKKFLEDKGYEIRRIAIEENRFGPDMIVRKNGIIIPVEIKARHKNNTLLYPRDNPIKQISRYIEGLESPFGILITTTEKIDPYKRNLPNNILLYTSKDLLEHFKDDKKLYEDLLWVRESVGQYKKDFIKEKRKLIINFIKKEAGKGRYPTYREIQETLKIALYAYFKNIYEAYEESGVDYPKLRKRKGGHLSKYEKEEICNKVIDFIRNEYKKGNKLNINKIEKIFHIDIRYYFNSRQEIYKLAGINFGKKEYMERFGYSDEERKETRERIIEFVKKLTKNNEKVSGKMICKKFGLDPHFYPYFRSLKEIMGLANAAEIRNM